MKARFLKLLNIPGLLTFALIAMAFQGTLFNNPSIAFFQPDIVLLLVLWVAMKRDFTEGGLLTLALSYLMEIKSGAPAGLFMTSSMSIFLATRFMYRNFQIINQRSLIFLGFLASIASQLIILIIMAYLGKATNQWLHTFQLLAPTAIVHGALIPIVFRFLHKFDLWTMKNPDAEYRYERDFYLDEEPI